MPVTSEDIALAHRRAARYRNVHHSNAENDDINSDALLAVTVGVDYWDTHPEVREATNRLAFLIHRVHIGVIDGLRERHGRAEDGYGRERFQNEMLRLDDAPEGERPVAEIVGGDDAHLEAILSFDPSIRGRLRTLSSREREILVRTILQGETLGEVAKTLDIHESRASQIRTRTLDRLRGAELLPDNPRAAEKDLSAREVEVLTHVAEGETNSVIAERLLLSEETIKSHIRHVLAKLHAETRTHAVTIGFRAGILH